MVASNDSRLASHHRWKHGRRPSGSTGPGDGRRRRTCGGPSGGGGNRRSAVESHGRRVHMHDWTSRTGSRRRRFVAPVAMVAALAVLSLGCSKADPNANANGGGGSADGTDTSIPVPTPIPQVVK